MLLFPYTMQEVLVKNKMKEYPFFDLPPQEDAYGLQKTVLAEEIKK